MPRILDGKRVRDEILAGLKPRVRKLAASARPPCLAVVLVGDDPASAIYVRNKVKTCEEIGIRSEQITPPSSITTGGLLGIVEELNGRADVDAILVQMPLPAQVDARRILLAMDPAKDVDGFHPMSVGSLVAGHPGPRACTPAGIMRLLEHYEIAVTGKKAVVVGRSDIVGKPMALLMLHADATVTICHSRTADLAAECRQAEILVAAVGKPALLGQQHVRPGAVVIDVGTNYLTRRADVLAALGEGSPRLAEFDQRGKVLVGDVHPHALELTSAYTPVPGGVGPLTIGMLMSNTVLLAEQRLGC